MEFAFKNWEVISSQCGGGRSSISIHLRGNEKLANLICKKKWQKLFFKRFNKIYYSNLFRLKILSKGGKLFTWQSWTFWFCTIQPLKHKVPHSFPKRTFSIRYCMYKKIKIKVTWTNEFWIFLLDFFFFLYAKSFSIKLLVGCQRWGHIQGDLVPPVMIMIMQHLSLSGHISSWKISAWWKNAIICSNKQKINVNYYSVM